MYNSITDDNMTHEPYKYFVQETVYLGKEFHNTAKKQVEYVSNELLNKATELARELQAIRHDQKTLKEFLFNVCGTFHDLAHPYYQVGIKCEMINNKISA